MLVPLMAVLMTAQQPSTGCTPQHPVVIDVQGPVAVEVVLVSPVDRELTLTLEDPSRPIRVLRWSPGAGEPMTRVIYLPKGCWRAVPRLEEGASGTGLGVWKASGALLNVGQPAAPGDSVSLSLQVPAVSLELKAQVPPAKPTTALRTPLGGGAVGAKRFGDSGAAGELLSIVAEIALEKASAAATRLISQTLARLCDQLVDSRGQKRLLPATCDAIRSLRLEDLASSGRQVGSAALRDMVALAKQKILARINDPGSPTLPATSIVLPAINAALNKLVSAAAEVVSGLATFDASAWASRGTYLAAEVLEVAKSAAKSCAPHGCAPLMCLAELAEQCVVQADCGPALIADMLKKPDDYASACSPAAGANIVMGGGALGSLRPVFGDVEGLMLKAAQVVHTGDESLDGRKRAALAVEIAAELVARLDLAVLLHFSPQTDVVALLDAASVAPGDTRSGCSSVPTAAYNPCRRLRSYGQFARLAAAALHLDLQAVLIEGTGILIDILPTVRPEVRRFASLITPVLSYLSTYKGDAGEEKSASELRAARKAAIEAFIAAGTDRDNRVGDHIFSLGASVLLQAGWGRGPWDAFTFGSQPLGATVGVAYTYHWRTWSGIQAQASFLDLGAYLRLGDGAEALTPDWNDMFQLGLDVGWSFAAGSVPAYVGTRFAWQPFISKGGDGKTSDGMFVGFVLGAYVPFFDFN